MRNVGIKQQPRLRTFLLGRIIWVMGILALILILSAEAYIYYFSKRERSANFGASMEAAAKAIRSDIDLGDLWSVRRNLNQILELGIIKSVKLSNETNGEILTIPENYNWRNNSQNSQRDYYEIVWQSHNEGSKWRLTGYPTSYTVSSLDVRVRTTYLLTIFIFLLTFSLLIWRLAAKLVVDIETIVTTLGKINPNETINDPNPGLITMESFQAFTRIKETSSLLVTAVQKQKELAVQAALGQAAQQLAHDIRSPLAALDSALGTFSEFPEDRRQIVRSAVNRIRDIANGLLEKNREAHLESPKADEKRRTVSQKTEAHLIFTLTDALATEKRVQYRSNAGVEIMTVFKTSAYGLFSKIDAGEFKRVLSNLIDNSVEALNGQGIITILLSGEGNQIKISVTDNGKGIPMEILSKLGQKGATFGKTGGSGLGLYHAKTTVEQWGGELKIQSELGRGTTVAITLPKAQPPEWFISEINLDSVETVITLDDDPAIQQVWRGRLAALNNKIEAFYFSTPAEIRSWVKDNQSKVSQAVFLMDYELLGFKETGLTLAEELNIPRRTILVTSRYEEKEILNECLRLGVRMIPKSMVGFVPIEIQVQEVQEVQRSKNLGNLPNVVLIDDDQLVHLTWKTCAKKAAVELLSFNSPDDFEKKHKTIPKNTTIYIDSVFPNGVRGEKYVARLRELGFHKITLTTGSDAQTPSLVAAGVPVIGKEPPFDS